MNNRNNKTIVVGSPMVNISHQQSKKAAKAMNKIYSSENEETVKNKGNWKKIQDVVKYSEEQLENAINELKN